MPDHLPSAICDSEMKFFTSMNKSTIKELFGGISSRVVMWEVVASSALQLRELKQVSFCFTGKLANCSEGKSINNLNNVC
jgi:hypothetical protein